MENPIQSLSRPVVDKWASNLVEKQQINFCDMSDELEDDANHQLVEQFDIIKDNFINNNNKINNAIITDSVIEDNQISSFESDGKASINYSSENLQSQLFINNNNNNSSTQIANQDVENECVIIPTNETLNNPTTNIINAPKIITTNHKIVEINNEMLADNNNNNNSTNQIKNDLNSQKSQQSSTSSKLKPKKSVNTSKSTHKKSQHQKQQSSNEPHKSPLDNANNHNINNQDFKNLNTKKYIIEYPYKIIKHNTDKSHICNFFRFTFSLLVNIILIVPVILFLILILPIKFIFRLTFKLFHICHLTGTSHFSPDLIPEFLSPIELFWLYNSNLLNKNNNNDDNNNDSKKKKGIKHTDPSKSVGACLFFIEGYLAKNTIRDLILNRIVEFSARTGQCVFDRFTQRLYNIFAYGYVWLNCTNFNIDEHVIEIEEKEELKTEADLQGYISKLLSTNEFSIEKPLWKIYYKKNFTSERTTVVIFLFHMCFADGLSLIRIFFKSLVDNRNQFDIKPRFAYFRFNFALIKQYIFGWSNIIFSLLLKSKDFNPLHRDNFKSERFNNLKLNSNTNSNEKPKKFVVWSEPFSLVAIHRLKLVTRSKMNDLLISIVAGILRNYLQIKGINNPTNIKCFIPVDLTCNRYPFKLANNSTLASVSLPVNVEGCIPRLWSTKNSTNYLKQSSDYLFVYFYIKILFNLLPNSMAFYLIKKLFDKNTFLASTLGAGDSSLATVSLCNRNVRNIIYFYPTVCNVSTSVSIVTYGDEVRLSLMADSDIITNPEFITTEFIKQLETLNDLLANRRIPGEIRRALRPPIDTMDSNMAGILYTTDDIGVDEMQQKMADIQQELQVLSEYLENLDQNSADYNKQKQIVTLKSEKLRKEFRNILMRLQIRQNLNSQAIPSDDEDELDPDERVRLRSSSIASRASMNSNSRRNSYYRDSTAESERQVSSRKPSIGAISRQGSLSFSSGISNMVEMFTKSSDNTLTDHQQNSHYHLHYNHHSHQHGHHRTGHHLNHYFHNNNNNSNLHASSTQNQQSSSRSHLTIANANGIDTNYSYQNQITGLQINDI